MVIYGWVVEFPIVHLQYFLIFLFVNSRFITIITFLPDYYLFIFLIKIDYTEGLQYDDLIYVYIAKSLLQSS